MMLWVPFSYKIANIFLSLEYVDERRVIEYDCNPEGMVQTRPPVWRSQLVTFSPLICVKEWPFGEKLSHPPSELSGLFKVLTCSRVTASRICTPLFLVTAINLLHGDHAYCVYECLVDAVATTGSHETGSPCITLAKGWAYCWYSPHTIDVLGDRGSADIYMCGADMVMTPKNASTKREQSLTRLRVGDT